MLYQISVKAEINCYSKSLKLIIDPYIIKINTDDKDIINELCIQRKVSNYESYLPKFIPGSKELHINPTFDFPHNPYYQEIIELLQHIESLGSFWMEVKRIYWNNLKVSWIPENEEEAKKIKIHDVEYNEGHNIPPKMFNPKTLIELVKLKDKYTHLVIPMAFFREGMNEYQSQHYINAFHNFYYYLEDLYGGGKTKNRQVVDNFKKSSHFTNAVEKTIKDLTKPSGRKHMENLKRFLSMESCSLSVDGIISLIVKVRGNLHHFSQKSSKKTGHPFNQKDFHVMAYLLMSICIFTFCHLTTGEKPR
jgi:hypothetical protein